jgi:glycine/D-amino acid oxidase-like deaminating enzyme
MTRYDVAIVGAGIVGASAAYAIARAGARIVAIDAVAPGAGTSGSSFAWLNAVRKEPDVYHRLNADGMSAHRTLARELGGDTGHHDGGSLEWADGGDAERELRARVARLAHRGYPAEWISRDRAGRIEAGLSIPAHVTEVAFYAGDGWLDAPRLIGCLIAGAAERGATILKQTPVRSFRMRAGRVEALAIDGGEIVAESVLVCVGPATQELLALLGVTVPVGRVPGLLAVTSRPPQPLARVVHAPGIHLRPDATGGLLLGAGDVDTLAANGGSTEARWQLAALLLDRAIRVFPSARDVRVVASRMGVRPMPADGHTIAGRIPGFENAWVLATHSGVTLGPLLGQLISAEIVGGTPSDALAPFRPERFAVAGAAR